FKLRIYSAFAWAKTFKAHFMAEPCLCEQHNGRHKHNAKCGAGGDQSKVDVHRAACGMIRIRLEAGSGERRLVAVRGVGSWLVHSGLSLFFYLIRPDSARGR